MSGLWLVGGGRVLAEDIFSKFFGFWSCSIVWCTESISFLSKFLGGGGMCIMWLGVM